MLIMQCPPKSPITSLRNYFSRLGITTNLSEKCVNSDGHPSNPRRAMDRYALTLIKNTHFNRDEIAVLIHIFYKLCKGNLVLKGKEFKNFLIATFRVTNATTLAAYVRAIDTENSGYINACRFVKVMNVILRGHLEEKALFVFQMLDMDRNGILMRSIEVAPFMTNMFHTEITASNPDADPNEPERDSLDYLMEKLDPLTKDKCTESTFLTTMQKYPLLMESCFPVWPDEKYIIAFQRILLIQIDESSIFVYNNEN